MWDQVEQFWNQFVFRKGGALISEVLTDELDDEGETRDGEQGII